VSNGSPTISAGQVPRQPTYWDDLTQVTKILQPDGTYANGTAAILYAANGLPWPGVTMLSASFSRSTTGTILSAVAGRTYKIYAIKLICDAAAAVFFQTTGASALEGSQSIAANGGYVESVEPPAFLFETGDSAGLQLNVSGGGTAAGRVSYWLEVPAD
jgi:hypothetical protein